MQKMMHHPSHPQHWLTFVRYPSGFVCNGCGEDVHGCGYRCADCNFDLHECCATAPPALDQSFHGGNGNCVHFQTGHPGGSPMQCSDCGGSVSGMGYYCTSSSCWYALHPTCALLPKSLTQLETPPNRHANYVETPPTRHAHAQIAPLQPDLKSEDKIDRRYIGHRMALRGGKFLLNLGLGAITGDPSNIVGACAELVLPD